MFENCSLKLTERDKQVNICNVLKAKNLIKRKLLNEIF